MRQPSAACASSGTKSAKSSCVAPARSENGPPAWMSGGSRVKAASRGGVAIWDSLGWQYGIRSRRPPGDRKRVQVRRARPERVLEEPGALEIEVRVRFPRETHAAVVLDVVGRVGERGVGREHLGR